MAYDQYLTNDQKRAILEQRLAQFAAEAFQHDINRQVAEATNNTEGVTVAEQALEILSTAITVHEQQLENL